MKTQTRTRRLPGFITLLIEAIGLTNAFAANKKKQSENHGNSGLTVSRLRRSAIYRPLAIAMAIFLTPVFSWFGGGAGLRPFQSSAQVNIGSCTPGGNRIIQNFCVNGVVFADDLNQLEDDAVTAYLALHQLPPTDAHVIYNFGRADLRNAIRGVILSIMKDIITKPQSSRTSHETNLYNWLLPIVHQNEIGLYTNAANQYAAWQNSPCSFTLDPTIASTYGLSYDGSPFCLPTLLNTSFGGPPVPAESYFTAYGLKKSYGEPADRFPYFGSLVAGSAVSVGEVAGIATGAGALVAAGVSTALAVSFSAAVAAFETGAAITAAGFVGTLGGVASTSAAFALSGGAVSALGGAAAALAAPASIITIAIAIGITAGMEAFSKENTINDLDNLTKTLTQVTKTNPDLNAFATDLSGVGMYKLQTSVGGQTVPEVPRTAPLPAHQTGNFVIGTTNTSVLTYQDWDQITWSAQTWGGWFVQSCTSGAAKCAQADSIIGSIRYVDWSGVKWTASRIGNNFVSTKAQPDPTDKPCPADPFVGDFSHCTSYSSTTIPITDAVGNHVGVSLSPLNAPAFTSPAALPFTPGVASTQTIVASGNPSPGICWVAGVLPAGFSLNGGGCGSGAFTVTFNGDPATPNGNYSLTLTASNGIAPDATQVFTLNVNQHLGITSPSVLTGTAGKLVSFLVTTTGNPVPKLSIDQLIPLYGLTFKDNGNGTATISGTAPVGFSTLGCSPTPCGITASNSQGTVTQPFGINMASPPAASLAPPTEATFTAGFSNSIDVTFTGALTPVTWLFQAPPQAPWLSLTSDLTGPTTLKGTPPIGTAGTFTFPLTPVAAGSLPSPDQTFTLHVVSSPVFSSSNTASFTVGTADSFPISVNVGTIGLVGTLPKGLSFTGGSPASLSGTPAPGTGGQYPVTLTVDAGTLGSTTQSLRLNVYEAPKITSPNSATFLTGMPGALAVITTGLPSVSSQPAPQNPLPPTSPNQGRGMYFTVTGLPSTLQFGNLNPQGLATGTLTIQGTPSAADAGVHQVQITAQNGVGLTAQQTLTLAILPPASVGNTIFSARNGTLSVPKILTSPSGRFKAVMQADGNFVVYDQTKPIWASNTSGKGSAPFNLAMQSDGNLVAYANAINCPGCSPTWASGTNGKGIGPYTLAMQDDGNLVIYDSTNTPIWATGTNEFQNIITSESAPLKSPNALTSPNGNYRAVMQGDGNFVLYHGTAAIWSTGTNSTSLGTQPYELVMRPDGDLALLNYANTCTANTPCPPVWESYSKGTGGTHLYTLTMQDDGNLVIYDSTNTPIWATGTNGQ